MLANTLVSTKGRIFPGRITNLFKPKTKESFLSTSKTKKCQFTSRTTSPATSSLTSTACLAALTTWLASRFSSFPLSVMLTISWSVAKAPQFSTGKSICCPATIRPKCGRKPTETKRSFASGEDLSIWLETTCQLQLSRTANLPTTSVIKVPQLASIKAVHFTFQSQSSNFS